MSSATESRMGRGKKNPPKAKMQQDQKIPTANQVERQAAKEESMFKAEVKSEASYLAGLTEARNASLSLRITREDIKQLENVRRYGNSAMNGLLTTTEQSVKVAEVQQFLEWQKKQDALEFPNLTNEGAGSSLIRAPAYSREELVSQGFSRMHARVIQRKIDEQRKQEQLDIASSYKPAELVKLNKRGRKDQIKQQVADRLASRANDKAGSSDSGSGSNSYKSDRKSQVEDAVRQGWRPEHVSLLNTLRSYNTELTENIDVWEQEELLVEYLEEFLENPDSDECKSRFKNLGSIARATAEDLIEDEEKIDAWFDKREAKMYAGDSNTEAAKRVEHGMTNLDAEWPEERFRYVRRRAKFARMKDGTAPLSYSKASMATRAKYNAWYEESDKILLDKDTMTEFPAPPIKFCGTRCSHRRNGLLGFCEHSLKKWYLCVEQTGGDLEETLKAEARRWHPDRFGKCAPEVKAEIVLKATELFQLIQRVY